MFRFRLATIVAVTAFAVAAALSAAAIVTVKSAHVGSLGTVVVSASGRTLYHDTTETKGTIKCTGACASSWPPLLIAAGAKPSAGPGVKASLLGTIKRAGDKVQVTYHGMPLYRYIGDTKSGQANGEAVGGVWFAVSTSGSVVKKASSSASTSPTSSGSTSGSTSSGSSSSGSNYGTTPSGGSTTTSPASTTSTTPSSGGTSTDCAVNPGADGCM